MTTDDAARVFDTLLSAPGMSDVVKIDFKIKRKSVLLLNHVLERGLSEKGELKPSNFLGTVPEEDLQELKALSDECLQKAGLSEFSVKLNALNAGK